MAGATASLEEATREARGRLDATPLMGGLRSGTLSRVGYLGHLRLLAVIHACVERAVPRSAPTVAEVAAVRDESSRPYPFLLADLEHFRLELVPDVPSAMDVGFKATQTLVAAAADSPHALLGPLFVLETLLPSGGPPRALCESLGVGAGRGASYLVEGGREAAKRQARFTAVLDAHLGDASGRSAATEAALRLLSSLEAASGALEPAGAGALGFHVASLNPEAGGHDVTQDPRELRAVLDATDRCLARHPYFVSRYGGRGRRFTDSDGAWLAHLVEQDDAQRTRLVDWLGRLLAARGMPTRLLQIHLEILAEELTRAVPENEGRYRLLQDEAARLDGRIRSSLPPEEATALVDAFAEAAVGLLEDPQARELGFLLVAAVADEAAGLRRAVPGVWAWVADVDRFSSRWVAAADELLSAARAAAVDPR